MKKKKVQLSAKEKFILKEMKYLNSIDCAFLCGLHHATVKKHVEGLLKRLKRAKTL